MHQAKSVHGIAASFVSLAPPREIKIFYGTEYHKIQSLKVPAHIHKWREEGR
jgi:hypothetical protein